MVRLLLILGVGVGLDWISGGISGDLRSWLVGWVGFGCWVWVLAVVLSFGLDFGI